MPRRNDWKRLGVNLSPEELIMLNDLCHETGLSQTRQIALLIRQAHKMQKNGSPLDTPAASQDDSGARE